MQINCGKILAKKNPQTIAGSGFCCNLKITTKSNYMANVHKDSVTQESGIYIIKSSIDSRVYIGQSSNLINRQKWHFRELKNNRHNNVKLQRHVNKYGISCLQFEVLEYTPKDKVILCHREQYYMDLHKPYFNIAPSAYSTLGVKKSEDERRRMSERCKGIKQKPEHIAARAIAKVGVKRKPFTEEHKKNIALGRIGVVPHNKGKKMPEEQRQRLITARTGMKMPDSFKEKMKSVTKGEKNGMYGRTHSEETKNKIRQKRLAYYARMKEDVAAPMDYND